jgi:uncharacterized membrane protein YbhN (UPF0104 family)
VSNYLASGAGVVSLLASLRLEHGVKVSRSLIVFSLTKVGDLMAIWLGLLISCGLLWDRIGILRGPVILLLAGIGIAIGLVGLVIALRQGFVGLLEAILVRFGLADIPVVRRGLAILQTLAEMDPGRLASRLGWIFLFSSVYLLFNIAWAYANFRVFHVQLSVVSIAFVNMLIQVISLVPIQVFGGLGVSEVSMLYFFETIGSPQSALVSPLIGIRILFYFSNLVPLLYLPVHGMISRRSQTDEPKNNP